MCTVYFHKQDYRAAMQSPTDPARAHAICRRLTGCSQSWPDRKNPPRSRLSHWYGAHYWAACAFTSHSVVFAASEVESAFNLCTALAFWYRAFCRECSQADGVCPPISPAFESLWNLAVRRVRQIMPEAVALNNSVLW